MNVTTGTIQIKINKRDDSIRPWVALPYGLTLPIGFGESIKQALADFERKYEEEIGVKPKYKWK